MTTNLLLILAGVVQLVIGFILGAWWENWSGRRAIERYLREHPEHPAAHHDD